ncbi:hypothetical protein [Sedimenticola sp.]|uniref:hypothetical protein n=1 Tax=Sedimenticola sp. TaxID=1940285 RepID=UPI003D0E8625
MNKENSTLFTLLLIAIGMTIVEVLLNSKGEFAPDSTQSLWGLISLILTIIWAVADSETNNFDKPFDFGFLMYVFWPIALPYYLCKTRGADGLILFIGFIGIWLGPWLAGLVAYTYIYAP